MELLKNYYLRTLIFLFFFICSLMSFSQTSEGKKREDIPPKNEGIDPRQFVTVFELFRPKNESRTIYRKDSIKINTVDVNSLITLTFNQNDMKNNPEYYGNVSVRAEIDDELIKVAPYSKVGEKQSEIGVKTATPNEVSAHFASMIDRMEDIEREVGKLYFKEGAVVNYTEESGILIETDKSNKSLDKEISEYFKNIKPDNDTIVILENLTTLIQNRIKELSRVNATLLFFSKGIRKLKPSEIAAEFEEIIKKTDDDIIKEEKEISRNVINECRRIKKSIEFAQNYFDYFRNPQDPELKNLFLRLIKQDELTVNQVYQELNFLKNIIDEITVDNYQAKNTKLINQLLYTFQKVRSYNRNVSSILLDYKISTKALKDDIFKEENEDDSKKRREYIKKLGLQIAELIYQRLFNAQIDLRTSRAKSGQILKISILWYRDNTAEPMVLPVGQFKLKEVGWRTNILDSFLLVNRNSTPTNDENISPSNFKGSPGVSLIRTFGNNSSKDLFRKIEPSFGINVSYLDFYENKDLEVGVGAIFGLFNNKVFFTVGHNLHAEGNGGYIGIGFSFANIAGQLKK